VTYDDKSCELLDELFKLLEQVAPANENGGKYLWIRADRGPIEDFGNAEELIAEGEYKDLDAFTKAWKDWFPEEVAWYELAALEEKDRGFRFIRLAHKMVIVQDDQESTDEFTFVCKISEFVAWLIDGVQECLDMLRAGTYNEFVRKKSASAAQNRYDPQTGLLERVAGSPRGVLQRYYSGRCSGIYPARIRSGVGLP
jgi:hypothetical protein